MYSKMFTGITIPFSVIFPIVNKFFTNKSFALINNFIGTVRDDIQKKKIILNGHCPLSSDPPPLA